MNRLALAALLAVSGLSFAAEPTPVAGAKLDSGLGDLPHYSHWVDKTGKNPMGHHVIGEKLDSGLGTLPNYRHWADKTGKDPLNGRVRVAQRD